MCKHVRRWRLPHVHGGSLRESLRLEFRHEGRQRAVTALPWCDAPQHPLAVMARTVEQAATEQLGAP